LVSKSNLKIKTQIILNRSDIGPENIIKKIGEKHQTEIIAKIPYSKKIEELYSRGKPIEHGAIQKIIDVIEK